MLEAKQLAEMARIAKIKNDKTKLEFTQFMLDTVIFPNMKRRAEAGDTQYAFHISKRMSRKYLIDIFRNFNYKVYWNEDTVEVKW